MRFESVSQVLCDSIRPGRQVNTFDAAIFVGVSSALAVMAMLACLVPALQAARLQPGSALRDE